MFYSEENFGLTDDVMMIEKESVELTSHPCSQEVIPESNGIISFLYHLKVYFEVSYEMV